MKDRMDSTQVRLQASDNHRDAAVASPTLDADADVATGSRAFFDPSPEEDFSAPTHKGTRWAKVALVFAVLAVGGAGFWWWHGRTPTSGQSSFKTSAASRGDIVQSVTANGQINAVKTVTVGSQVSGIITDIRVDFNSRVTNGQVIAQIDPQSYRQYLSQAEADLANAQASLKLAQVSFQRAKELRNAELISQADYDSADATLQQAEATVKTREASLNKAKVDLERTTISSPIDGVVISRAVDVGQTVAANFNAPTLFTIAQDLRAMRIEAAVSEADVGGVEEGQTVKFTVDAFPNRTFSGRVSQVRFEPVTSQNVVTYVAIVDVRNEDLKLRPGMTANATIITSERRNIVRVPNAALRFRPPEATSASAAQTPAGSTAKPAVVAATFASSSSKAGDRPAGRPSLPAGSVQSGVVPGETDTATKTVYLVNGEAPTQTLQPVQVQTGASDGSWTEILGGISQGDSVATGIATATQTTASVSASGGTNPFGPPRPPR